jgi:hypothetical protein
MSKVSATMPLVREPCRTSRLGGNGEGAGVAVGRAVGRGVGVGVGRWVGEGVGFGGSVGAGVAVWLGDPGVADGAAVAGVDPAGAVEAVGSAEGGAVRPGGGLAGGVHPAVGPAVGATTAPGEITVPKAAPARARSTTSMPALCAPWDRNSLPCMDHRHVQHRASTPCAGTAEGTKKQDRRTSPHVHPSGSATSGPAALPA